MQKFSKLLSHSDTHLVLRAGSSTAERLALENMKSRHAGGQLTDEQMDLERLSSYSKIKLLIDEEVIDHILSWLDLEQSSFVTKRTARDHNIGRHSRKLYRALDKFRREMIPC